MLVTQQTTRKTSTLWLCMLVTQQTICKTSTLWLCMLVTQQTTCKTSTLWLCTLVTQQTTRKTSTLWLRMLVTQQTTCKTSTLWLRTLVTQQTTCKTCTLRLCLIWPSVKKPLFGYTAMTTYTTNRPQIRAAAACNESTCLERIFMSFVYTDLPANGCRISARSDSETRTNGNTAVTSLQLQLGVRRYVVRRDYATNALYRPVTTCTCTVDIF